MTEDRIREAVYDRKLQDIENKRETIKSKMKQIKKKGGNRRATFEQIKNFFFSLNRKGEEYTEVEKEQQRQTLEKILLNASVKNDDLACYKLKPPYDMVAETPKNPSFAEMQAIQVSNFKD